MGIFHVMLRKPRLSIIWPFDSFITDLFDILVFLVVTAAHITALSADRFSAVHLHLRYRELVTHKHIVAAVSTE